MTLVITPFFSIPAGTAPAFGYAVCAAAPSPAIISAPRYASEENSFIMLNEGSQDATRPLRVRHTADARPATTEPPDPNKTGALEGIRRALDPREWRWKLLKKGHKRPGRIYKSVQTAEKRVINTELALIFKRTPFISFEFEREVERNREKEKSEQKYARAAEQNERLMERALSWMDAGYLGQTIFLRLVGAKPMLVTFASEPTSKTLDLIGGYHIGTNCIHTDYALFRNLEEIGTRIVQISHELHHYAAWLGGGTEIRWRDETGTPRFRKRAFRLIGRNEPSEPLSEGLTEMLAHQVALGNGVDIRSPRPDKQPLLGLIIQELVGRNALRRAYFSGNYTLVVKRLDEALGQGAFVRILEIMDEGYYHITDALEFLVERIDERNVRVGEYWRRGLGKVMFDENEDLTAFIPSAYR